MVARSSVTDRGRGGGVKGTEGVEVRVVGVRNAGLSYRSGTTRSRTERSSKQPNKPALLSTVRLVLV